MFQKTQIYKPFFDDFFVVYEKKINNTKQSPIQNNLFINKIKYNFMKNSDITYRKQITIIVI